MRWMQFVLLICLDSWRFVRLVFLKKVCQTCLAASRLACGWAAKRVLQPATRAVGKKSSATAVKRKEGRGTRFCRLFLYRLFLSLLVVLLPLQSGAVAPALPGVLLGGGLCHVMSDMSLAHPQPDAASAHAARNLATGWLAAAPSDASHAAASAQHCLSCSTLALPHGLPVAQALGAGFKWLCPARSVGFVSATLAQHHKPPI